MTSASGNATHFIATARPTSAAAAAISRAAASRARTMIQASATSPGVAE